MTIPEATNLVLQSSIMTNGGEVFLLDMGKPVKIYDLAEKMINLSGLTIKSFNNPSGDIEIITTGLRPGEKLYEELLIDGNSSKTKHPLIFKSKEKLSDSSFLWENINNLEIYCNKNELDGALKTLSSLVPEWIKLKL